VRHFFHNRLILIRKQQIDSFKRRKIKNEIPLRKSTNSEFGLSGALRFVAIDSRKVNEKKSI
jgi:hypothetical protein